MPTDDMFSSTSAEQPRSLLSVEPESDPIFTEGSREIKGKASKENYSLDEDVEI